jgi:hypothetical protein
MSNNWKKIDDDLEILGEIEIKEEDEFSDMPILERMQSPPSEIHDEVYGLNELF